MEVLCTCCVSFGTTPPHPASSEGRPGGRSTRLPGVGRVQHALSAHLLPEVVPTVTPGIRPYARCHYHAPGHTMGACQAYYGGKGHTMVGSGTGILWQYFMNTLFLAPYRRRSPNRRRHNTRSAQRAPLCSRPTTTTQLYIQSVLRCMMP